MENMDIYEKVRSVPKEALKPITGGRLKGMSDINPMWRLKMLTELFGICGIGWKVEITDKRLEKGSGDEVVCFVDINLYVKVDGEWSAPIPGMGGSSFVTQERNGLYTSDECFKMAYTDAISVACKSLGFAADVYFANDRTKYTGKEDEYVKNKSDAPETKKPPEKQDSQKPPKDKPNGSSNPINSKSKAINLMNKLKLSWDDMAEIATEVLKRPIKKVITDIKTEEEWAEVAVTLEITLNSQGG